MVEGTYRRDADGLVIADRPGRNILSTPTPPVQEYW